MTHFPGSPKLPRGSLVWIDAGNSAERRVIALQYNPATLSCFCQVKGVDLV